MTTTTTLTTLTAGWAIDPTHSEVASWPVT